MKWKQCNRRLEYHLLYSHTQLFFQTIRVRDNSEMLVHKLQTSSELLLLAILTNKGISWSLSSSISCTPVLLRTERVNQLAKGLNKPLIGRRDPTIMELICKKQGIIKCTTRICVLHMYYLWSTYQGRSIYGKITEMQHNTIAILFEYFPNIFTIAYREEKREICTI